MAPASNSAEQDLALRFARDAIPLLDQLHRAARNLSRTPADAEDLVQETMLRAYAGFSSYTDGSNIRAWLFTIMNNAWITAHRAAKSRPAEHLTGDVADLVGSRRTSSAPMSGPSAEAEALRTECSLEVRQALQMLPEPQRLAVYLAHVEGLRRSEIARILNITTDAVFSRTYRGRQKMRCHLLEFAVRRRYLTDRGLTGEAA
ncbi:sigma-70 family RNA polymerase sigma factor [Mycolicibacter minnesotensis]